eukprot:3931005-Alexandrium_andersonii.AAC.1
MVSSGLRGPRRCFLAAAAAAAAAAAKSPGSGCVWGLPARPNGRGACAANGPRRPPGQQSCG